MDNDNILLTRKDLATMLGVSVGWLEIRAYRGDGPPQIKLGVRHRTGRIARFSAQTRNGSARLPVPIDLGALGR